MADDLYLGDGVYASFDGYHIILDLRAQDDTTRIALEPAVFDSLLDYANRVWTVKRPSTEQEEDV